MDETINELLDEINRTNIDNMIIFTAHFQKEL